jgi:hypothetical protein
MTSTEEILYYVVIATVLGREKIFFYLGFFRAYTVFLNLKNHCNFRSFSIYVFLWWVGSRPTAPTPNLGDQDFLSGLSPLAFGIPTPLLQSNKICNPRQGLLQGAISRSQLNPVFFFEVVTPPPPPFSTGLGTGYGGVWKEIQSHKKSLVKAVATKKMPVFAY